ncbi:MAG: hypothetical protein ACPGNT_03475 [Rhodospirillales bacterium]
MGWFGLKSKAADSLPPVGPPVDIAWALNPRGRFWRLTHLDPEEVGLGGAAGVYVIWHGGVKPRWVFIDRTQNIASALHAAGENDDIMQWEVNGRLFVSWALVKDQYQAGVAAYLNRTLKPLVENPGLKSKGVQEIAVKPPSRETPL